MLRKGLELPYRAQFRRISHYRGDAVHTVFIIGSQSVLKLVEIADARITHEEFLALHQVIGQLGDYIRRTAPKPEADKLLLPARQNVAVPLAS